MQEEGKTSKFVDAWEQFAAANQAASQAKPKYELLAKRLLWVLIIPAFITTLATWGWLGAMIQNKLSVSPSRFFLIVNTTVAAIVLLVALYLSKIGENWVAPRRAANMFRDALRKRRAGLITDVEFDQQIRDAQEIIGDNELMPWNGDVKQALPKFATFVKADTGYCALGTDVYVEMIESKMKYHASDAVRETKRIQKYGTAAKLLPVLGLLLALVTPALSSLMVTIGLLADKHLANLRLVASRDRNRWTAKELGKLKDEYASTVDKTQAWQQDWMRRVENVWAQEQASWASSYGAMAAALAQHAALPGAAAVSK